MRTLTHFFSAVSFKVEELFFLNINFSLTCPAACQEIYWHKASSSKAANAKRKKANRGTKRTIWYNKKGQEWDEDEDDDDDDFWIPPAKRNWWSEWQDWSAGGDWSKGRWTWVYT